MNETWLIDDQTLQAAGVSSMSFQFANQAEDTLTLRLVDGGTPRRSWTYGSKVVVKLNGGFFFTGWVSQPSSSTAAGDGGTGVVISGPWWWLTRITFGRVIPPYPQKWTSVNIFIAANQVLQRPSAAMAECLEWASQASGRAFAVGHMGPSSDVATPKPEWVEGVYCDEVAKKIAGYAPDSAMWVDYTRAVPMLHWTAPGARRTMTHTQGTAPFTGATLEKSETLAPTAVIVRYDLSHGDLASAGAYALEEIYPPGYAVDSPGVAVFTLADDDYVGPMEFARMIWEGARSFLWGGTITTEAQIQDIKPGDTIAVRGRAEWADSLCLVQRVAFNPGTLQYTINVGAPEHLGLTDLLDLYWWLGAGDAKEKVEENHHPWELYAVGRPGAYYLYLAPGNVSDGKTSIVPTWQGIKLDATNKPGGWMRVGFNYTFYLKVTWEPDRDTYVGTDELGEEITVYKIASTGSIKSATIETSRRDNTAPDVHLTSGYKTSGIFYFPLLHGREVDYELITTQYRSNDLQLMFIPPNQLYLLGE